ncbi:MAG: phosphoribosylformylglycinamidine synthase [Amycolatopsis sp.]|nr:phosphoribosylformylglycinamidine synthase [Amycolatopsis sp.]
MSAYFTATDFLPRAERQPGRGGPLTSKYALGVANSDTVADSPVDSVDTTARAGDTPELAQPYLELGLAEDEYARIREILGRRPTDAELAMYSIMWSEHCSYKSSKKHLGYFSETATPEMKSKMLAGIGENAGVVDIGDGWAVTFKVESHNHPSYVEPYQGAATGVGGIVRDIMAMGARPIAVADALRFGPADAPDTRRVLPGVVAGVAGYGNCLGLPNIGGELVFDASYAGNPLVNALCIGAMRVEDLHLAFATGTGNKIILFGARTGLDGIGGVSVLASDTFSGDESESGRRKLPSVQVGDPFTEKVLIECCLDLFAQDLVAGIQDLGGAGLACATSELAASGEGGMRVELERVPLRAQGMSPAEVLSSESQERMCAVVAPADVEAFMAVCAKWDVIATEIGEVTEEPNLVITWHGETVVDVPPRTVAHQGPVYDRPIVRPSTQDALQADTSDSLARPSSPDELRAAILKLIASPNQASKEWVTQQYDRYVRGNTVLSQPSNSGVVRIDESTGRGVAVSTDCNSKFVFLDPYAGAQAALAEAYRNVATSGATPVAVSDCLNFGAPTDPGVMWQFERAVHGIADGCVELGIPVTGGNVSFFNQTGDTAIQPTPVVAVLGVIDDVKRRIPTGVGAEAGETLLLLGETHDELDGSAWAQIEHGHLGGLPPKVDLTREKLLADILIAGSRDGMISAAHDLSDGGLAQTLVETVLIGQCGARVFLDAEQDPFVQLFSESAGRVLVAVPRTEELRFTEMCTARGLPWRKTGVVDPESGALEIQDLTTFTLDELREPWEATLPALFD